MGSDYWSLTFECAKYVFEKLCKEKSFIKYFKTSFVPSEMCVQTIVFNSKFSGNTISFNYEDYKGLANLTPLHYIEYGKSIKIFDETDFNTLINSGKMFFRKASTEKSMKLLNMIDEFRSR